MIVVVQVPHSNCVRGNFFDEYTEGRGCVAIDHAELLPVDVTNTDNTDRPQPCGTFGLHPELPLLKELWDAGQASFFANIGAATSLRLHSPLLVGAPMLAKNEAWPASVQQRPCVCTLLCSLVPFRSARFLRLVNR